MRLRQPYGEIKTEAKQILLQNARICLMISLAAGLFYLVVLIVQSYYAVGLVLEFADSAKDTARSAFSFGAGGLSMILRIEELSVVARAHATVPQLIGIAIMQLFSIILTAPAIFGARALLCRLSDGEKIETADLKSIFRWYTDLNLAVRAIVLFGLVSVLEWFFQLLSAGIGLYFYFSETVAGPIPSGGQLLPFVVFLGSICLLFGGLLLTWSLLPAGWLLAREPSLSPAAALRRCRRLLRGRMTDHFLFRVSFVLWFLCNVLTYNALLLFLFPYFQIAEARYLKRLESDTAQLLPPNG